MKNVYKLMIILVACVAANAQDTMTNSYIQTNLVSDIPGMATNTDSHLVNPWGLSRTSGSYWWASDQGTGVSTLYDGSGNVVSLVVTVPPASGTGAGSPTGTVALGSSFVFVTLDGTISQWTGGTAAKIKVNNLSKRAVYTGVTAAKNGTVQQLYVANAAGGVEAYTSAFAPVTLAPGAFTDPSIPAGYTPYGIQSVGAKIYVTFSAGPGAGGFVDAFDPTGKLLVSIGVGSGSFNEPWGIAQAPKGWGAFGNSLLVGNVGSGKIGAYSPSTGKFLGFLKGTNGHPLVNSGLWAIFFGNGTLAGRKTTLYFAAGIDNYLHGLFGSIVP
jgi:uncharacterized protein (TIGR03118 family)